MANQEEWITRAPDLSTILSDTFDINEQRNDPLQLTNTTNEYYDLEDLENTVGRLHVFNHKLIHLNIHSLPDKFDRLKLLLNKLSSVTLNPDYILLCETFFTDQTASLYQIPGYKLVHKSRTAKTRGRVAIYVRDNIPFHVREDLGYFVEGEFESIFTETTQSGLKHSIIG